MGVIRAKIKFWLLSNAFIEDNFLYVETRLGKAIPQNAKLLGGGYDKKDDTFFIDFEHPDIENSEEFEIQPEIYYRDELAIQS